MKLLLAAAIAVHGALAQALAAQQAAAARSAQGRILDVLGEPVPAAVVWVTDAQGRELGRGTSDGSGLFAVHALPYLGALALHVNASGKVEWRTALAPWRSFAATVVLEDAGPLRGVAQDAAGASIANAHVVAWAEAWPGRESQIELWHADTVTDERGEFVFPAAPLRQCSVRVWAPAWKMAQAQSAVRDAPLVIALAAGPQQPRLIRVDGLPAGAAARVFVGERARMPALLPAPLREAAVGPDGTAALWPLPVAHMVGVRAVGFTSRPESVPAAADSDAACRFAMSPVPPDLLASSTAIAAEVDDALGHPIGGVEVIAATLDGAPCGGATSGADGRVAVTVPVRKGVLCRLGFGPGRFRLGDPHASFGDDGTVWLDVAADADRLVRLHSLPAASIRGACGVPFAPIDLAERSQPGKTTQLLQRVRTSADAAGRFELNGLPGGTWRVIAHLTDQQAATADVDLGEGVAMTIDKLDTDPAGEVRGVVRDQNGGVAPGVWLDVVPPTPALWGRRFNDPLPVLTDREGRYRLRGVAAGDWVIVAQDASPPPPGPMQPRGEPVTVEAGRTTQCDLKVKR
jgi:hypothetical protein